MRHNKAWLICRRQILQQNPCYPVQPLWQDEALSQPAKKAHLCARTQENRRHQRLRSRPTHHREKRRFSCSQESGDYLRPREVFIFPTRVCLSDYKFLGKMRHRVGTATTHSVERFQSILPRNLRSELRRVGKIKTPRGFYLKTTCIPSDTKCTTPFSFTLIHSAWDISLRGCCFDKSAPTLAL